MLLGNMVLILLLIQDFLYVVLDGHISLHFYQQCTGLLFTSRPCQHLSFYLFIIATHCSVQCGFEWLE